MAMYGHLRLSDQVLVDWRCPHCGQKHYGDSFAPLAAFYCEGCEALLDCEEVLDEQACAKARSAYLKREAVVSIDEIGPGESFVFMLDNGVESVPHYLDERGRAYHPSERFGTGRCYTTLQYEARRVRRL